MSSATMTQQLYKTCWPEFWVARYLTHTHCLNKPTRLQGTQTSDLLLIIDECQRLSSELLEEIRQLSNIEKQETKLLNIFFVGQEYFNTILQQDQNRALLQRISINYLLTPLNIHETGEFVRHRLKIAGAEKDIFSPAAIRGVFEFSSGFPRKINMICDHALLSGFAQGIKSINGKIIAECAKNLCLPASMAKPSTESQGTVDSSRLNSLATIPPEHRQEVSSIHAGRTIGLTLLVILAVLIFAYIRYPAESRVLYYACKNKGLQVFSIFWSKESPIVKNINAQYSKRDAPQGLDDENAVMPVSSKTVVRPLSISPSNNKEIEQLEKNIPPTDVVSSSGTPVAETLTTIDSTLPDRDATAVPDAPEEEYTEPAIRITFTKISPEIERKERKKIINDQDDATIEPPRPGERQEEITGEPEEIDPAAVIEWMIKNRAK